jgi:hypothetical protein
MAKAITQVDAEKAFFARDSNILTDLAQEPGEFHAGRNGD